MFDEGLCSSGPSGTLGRGQCGGCEDQGGHLVPGKGHRDAARRAVAAPASCSHTGSERRTGRERRKMDGRWMPFHIIYILLMPNYL